MRILVLASVLTVLTASHAWAGAVSVPEPASMALLALGIGGVALARFRRRR